MKMIMADDHVLFRDAIVQYIRRAEPSWQVLVSGDIHGTIELIDNNDDIDLILLDFRMPGMEGLNGLKLIFAHCPEKPIALLSGHAEEEDIRQAMLMGARGYFAKTMSGRAMLNGIHRILDGGIFVAMDNNTNHYLPSYYGSPAGSDNGTGHGPELRSGISAATFKLTPREEEVLQYLGRGVSNKEIARALDLQIVTVKLHVRGICRKLSAENRTQAAVRAKDLGLIVGSNPVTGSA